MGTLITRSSKFDRITEVLWAIAMICLPITSFPLFESLSGGLVAPLSILPFFALLFLTTLPLILRKGALPKETIPLIAFILAVILSCAAAFFIFIPGFKGRTIPGQEIRSLFTLAVGIIFYLVAATWIKSTGKLNNTWKYITIGGIISLIWTGVQAYFIFRHYNDYPYWVERIQFWLVVHAQAFSPRFGRVNGLAYEASWFAHQMVVIYLPIWMAATFHKTSAFQFRIFRLSLENFLLVFGIVAFFLSSPRIGLVSFLLMIVYLFLRLTLLIYQRLVDWISSLSILQKRKKGTQNRILITFTASTSIIAVYILVLAGVILFSIQRDWRLTTLVADPPTAREIIGLLTLDQTTLLELSHRFIFLERMVYWMNGWNIFNQYPWLGVGLGNAGFFFPQLAPSIGWASYEIRNVLFYLTQLPNVKSLWFRLLAETGLLGFSVFIAWFYTLYRSSKFSQHHHDPTIKTFAMAGQLALLAFIGEGLSIDSFAMPYFWIMAGIVAAIAMLYRGEIREQAHSD